MGVEAWQNVLFTSEFADMFLVCMPEGTKLPANSALLRSMSPVLRAMLESPMRENAKREIEVNDSEKTVRAFVRLACTGCVDDEDFSATGLLKVLDLAHRWHDSSDPFV